MPRLCRAVLCALLSLALSTVAFAQTLDADTFVPQSIRGLTDQSVGTFSVAWEDIDGDGDLDAHLVLPLNFADDRVLVNDGGVFVSESLTLDLGFPTSISAWVDLRNDGFPDAFVGSLVTRQAVYDGSAGGVATQPTQQRSEDNVRDLDAADIDGDGDLDLVLARRLGAQNLLLRNDGGLLVDATSGDLADLRDNAISASFVDYDNDGDADLYITGRSGNTLFETAEGTFMARPESPLSFPDLTAGSCWGDADADGDLDVYVTTQEGVQDRLFRNDLVAFVDDDPIEGERLSSISCAWGDLDLDADLDLVISQRAKPTLIYLNTDGDFQGFEVGRDFLSYSVALVDLDADGDLDVFTANGGPDAVEPNEMFLNAQASARTWLNVDLEGVRSNRQGVGAHVYATTFGATWHRQLREVELKSGLRTQAGTLAHFGLAEAKRADLEIRWPSGQVQVLKDVEASQRLTVTESAAPVSVAAVPTNSTRIPAEGGTFSYTLRGINFTDEAQTLDLWAYAFRPDGSRFGPVVGPVEVTLEPGARVDEPLRARIAADAPPGTYLGTAYLGDFEAGTVVSESSLHFRKEDGPPTMPWLWTTEFVATGETQEVQVAPANPVATETETAPEAFALAPAFPNPFAAATRLTYTLPSAEHVRLDVFDVLGRRVHVLVDEPQTPGAHAVVWDGRDASGARVANGLYLARLSAGDATATQRLSVAR